MEAGVAPTVLALAHGPLAAAVPAAADAISPVTQISANPTLAVRDSSTEIIGSAALALELEGPRDPVGRAGRRIHCGELLCEPELAGVGLHQLEELTLDDHEETEPLARREGAAGGKGCLDPHAIEDPARGHVTVNVADCKRLDPLRDLELPRSHEVDDRSRLGRHRAVACNGGGRGQRECAGKGEQGHPPPRMPPPDHRGAA